VGEVADELDLGHVVGIDLGGTVSMQMMRRSPAGFQAEGAHSTMS